MKILNQVYQDLKQYYSDTDIKIRAEYDTQRNIKSVVIDSGINIVIQIYHGRLNVSTMLQNNYYITERYLQAELKAIELIRNEM